MPRRVNERDPRRKPYHRYGLHLAWCNSPIVATSKCRGHQNVVTQTPGSPALTLLLRHRRLHEAARDGQPEEAAAILEEMSEHDLPPGPRAYHSLIVANAQAGRADEALNSLRAAWGEGAHLPPGSQQGLHSAAP